MLYHVRAFYFSLSCLSEQLLNGKTSTILKITSNQKLERDIYLKYKSFTKNFSKQILN